jgi:hypothetical protein
VKARAGELDAYDQFAVVSTRFQVDNAAMGGKISIGFSR